jgi:hypothetical protein
VFESLGLADDKNVLEVGWFHPRRRRNRRVNGSILGESKYRRKGERQYKEKSESSFAQSGLRETGDFVALLALNFLL